MPQHDRIERHSRRRKRLKVTFRPVDSTDTASTGFTEDVSGTGLFLQTGKVYPPRTVLDLRIEVNSRELELQGQVIWAKKAPLRLAGKKRCGMGIRLTTDCDELNAYAAQASGTGSG